MNGLAGLGALGCETGDLGHCKAGGNGFRPVFKGWLKVACLHACFLDASSLTSLEELRRREPWLINLLKSSVQVQADGPGECSDPKGTG